MFSVVLLLLNIIVYVVWLLLKIIVFDSLFRSTETFIRAAGEQVVIIMYLLPIPLHLKLQ